MVFCRWFQGFDWDGLLQRKLAPPIIPQVILFKTVTRFCSIISFLCIKLV